MGRPASALRARLRPLRCFERVRDAWWLVPGLMRARPARRPPRWSVEFEGLGYGRDAGQGLDALDQCGHDEAQHLLVAAVSVGRGDPGLRLQVSKAGDFERQCLVL